MAFEVGYGETPLPDDELAALLPAIRDLIGEPIGRADVYDIEQAIQGQVFEKFLLAVASGELGLHQLLDDVFVRRLHRSLYGDVWKWAGRIRATEVNIGVAPEQIAVELRNSLETLRYRWEQTGDWTSRQFGIAVHADLVRIHPFVDGNGRATRLLADLVYVAVQEGADISLYDWAVDKSRYIELLREYDRSRDPRDLSDFVQARPVGSQ